MFGRPEVLRWFESSTFPDLLKNKIDVILVAAEADGKAVELFARPLLGDEHPEVIACRTSLANLLHSTGDYERAEPLFREVLAMKRRQLGDGHPLVARGLNNLAMVLRSQGDYAAAEPLFRQAIAGLRRQPGGEHPLLGSFLNSLAKTLHLMGRTEEAGPLYAEGLAIKRRLLGEEQVSVAISLTDIAALAVDRGDPRSAEDPVRRALAIFRRRLPAGHWRIAHAESVHGACLAGLGRYAEAEPLLLGAYPALKETRGEEALETGEALGRLVDLYQAWGKAEEAARYRALLPVGSGASG